MPGYSNKYKKESTASWEVDILDILSHSPVALTIEQIQSQSIVLGGLTSQKMSKMLSHLNQMGMVRKGRSKSLNRMVYKATAVMEEQGYEVI